MSAQPLTKRRKGRKAALVAGLALLVLCAVMVSLHWAEIRAWYVFWRDFRSLGPNAQGYAEYRHRFSGIVFVSLPGGTFLMGSPDDEAERWPNEGPVHEVTLSPFMIAKYEVTQQQWETVLGAARNRSGFRGDTLPVEQVSWNDLHAEGGFLDQTGFTLPSEAQWEYACRAGTTGPFAGTGNLDDMGWYDGNGGATTHPVGQKQPNQFGLHDMHGNVWEWCEDRYREDFYQQSAGASDPVSTAGSESRIFRGGSWFNGARLCRSAARLRETPAFRSSAKGFRPVWSSR